MSCFKINFCHEQRKSDELKEESCNIRLILVYNRCDYGFIMCSVQFPPAFAVSE